MGAKTQTVTYCCNADKALHPNRRWDYQIRVLNGPGKRGGYQFSSTLRSVNKCPDNVNRNGPSHRQLTLRGSRAAAPPPLHRQSPSPLRRRRRLSAAALPTAAAAAAAADEHAGHVRVPTAVGGRRRRRRRSAARRRTADRRNWARRRSRRGVRARATARGHDMDHDFFRRGGNSALPPVRRPFVLPLSSFQLDPRIIIIRTAGITGRKPGIGTGTASSPSCPLLVYEFRSRLLRRQFPGRHPRRVDIRRRHSDEERRMEDHHAARQDNLYQWMEDRTV